jgi:ATP synthase protein I
MSSNGKDPAPERNPLSPEERDALSPGEREALRRRATELGKRLDEVRTRKAPQTGDPRARGAAMGEAFKIAVELIVGVVVGGGIGWALDRHLGTAPWLLIVFLLLGFAAGISNVIRTARRMQAAAEPLQRSAPSVPDDDEDGGKGSPTGAGPRDGAGRPRS